MIKETKIIKNGRVLSHNQKENPKITQKFWYVWFKSASNDKKNTEDPKILFQTCSTSKETAEEQKTKLEESGVFKNHELGIVSVDAEISNFHYRKSVTKKDLTSLSTININKFVVADTETTGFSKWDQVIDLAAVKVVDDEIVDKFQCYILPTCKLKEDSIKIHGLTMEFLKKNGVTAKEAFSNFKAFIKDAGPFVGHNISFDKRMIESHSSRVKVPIEVEIAFDTYKIAEKLLFFPDYKLASIIDILGLRKDLKSHSALDDVIGTFKVAKIIKEVYKA
jgi:DNA polymerase III alpha subunit (gram-positive type)